MLINCIFISVLMIFVSLTSHASTRQSGKIVGKGESAPQISLNYPKGGWTIDRMVRVSGSIDDTTVDPITISINAKKYYIRSGSGNFDRKFPVTSGKNTIIVQGTNKGGTTKVARTIYAKVPAVPIKVVLTSDTDGVYTDLHVYEPKDSLKKPFLESKDKTTHVYWASTTSPTGAKFYLNAQEGSYDQPGYGPYLYTHQSPPVGIYRIDANYWPSGDKAHTVGTLDVTLFGGTNKEVTRTVKMPLAMPGETVTIAFLKVEKGQKGSIFVPLRDPPPKNKSMWRISKRYKNAAL